jgi:nicotinamidase/pyrazinamidase
MNQQFRPDNNDALLIVDVQNDFCPGGALAVPGGETVIPVVCRVAELFDHVILTQDWHPRGHLSFASSHPGRKPLDVIKAPYGDQVLWPDHCIQGSEGAAFHRNLVVPRAELIIRKGFHRDIDSYSALYENDRRTPTGLGGYLRERGLSRLFIVGLAFDFCVRYSAEDASRHGFAAYVIEDGCRGIGTGDSIAATRRSLAECGVSCIFADAVA